MTSDPVRGHPPAATEQGLPPFGTMPPLLARAWRLSCTGEVEAAMAEAQRVHDQAEADADGAALRTLAASHMAWYCFMLGYYEEGILHALSARDAFSVRGDRERESWCRGVHAWLLIEIGAPNEALDEAMTALQIAEECGNAQVLSCALNVAGVVYWMLRQLDRAEEFSERAVAIMRELEDDVGLGRWLINLAGIKAEFWHFGQEPESSEMRRRVEKAADLVAEAQRCASRIGDSWAERIALCNLAEYQILLGRLDAADEALSAWTRLGGGGGVRSRLYYLFALGKLQVAQSTPLLAIGTLELCATTAEEVGDLEIGTPCCRALADVMAGLGRFEDALRWHREFHARHVRKSADSSQARSRVAAIHYETNQLRSRIDAERTRADGLEQMNRALAQEAKLLMHASMEDVLTGLPNRRRLERALLDLGGGMATYACAMMDIDRFKAINDTFSHSVGDLVLRQVALLLRDATREEDQLFRYGGEEFVLIMEGGGLDLCAAICERVQQVVRNWDWSIIQPDLQVTLSIGVADSEEAATPAQIMAIADERLYQAKDAGRDRVVTVGRFVAHHRRAGSAVFH